MARKPADPPRRPRTIVLLFDGTSNQVSAQGTNVVRLYRCLRKTDDQIVWYDPGVGTLAAPNSFLSYWARIQEVLGLATGWGLDRNVKEAYRFLVRHYRRDGDSEATRDRIVIAGFSRGAYTARVLAGFIRTIGLLDPRNLNLLDYAFRAYKRIGEQPGYTDAQGGAFGEVRLYETLFDPDHPPIHCLALFDTVASVIEFRGLIPGLRGFAYSARNHSVRHLRHAVALQERRRMFRPTLWPKGQRYHYAWIPQKDAPGEPQDVKEVWFTGCHGDIGGGSPEAASALAKLPLKWMIDELGSEAIGLDFSDTIVRNIVMGAKEGITPPDPNGPINESLKGAWHILEYLPARVPPGGVPGRRSLFGFYLPMGAPRTVPAGAAIHASVVARGPLPANVPAEHVVEL